MWVACYHLDYPDSVSVRSLWTSLGAILPFSAPNVYAGRLLYFPSKVNPSNAPRNAAVRHSHKIKNPKIKNG